MGGLLDGAVVAVTGAASGIGRATVVCAAAEGARGIVVSDRNGAGLDGLVAELTARGTAVEAVPGEMTDPSVPDRIVAVAVEAFGRLDAAVNNAGIRGAAATIDVSTDADFDEVIDVNLRSVYRCLRAELRQMYTQGSGSVVNVASATVLGVSPGLAPYAASKVAVISLSKVASKEAGPHGVRVNVVAPGRTDTPMLAENTDRAALVAPIPLGRFGRPAELADSIVYLCSSRSSFVNGATLAVDGGRTG